MKRRVFGFLALALGIVLAACSGGTDYVGVSESSTTVTYSVTVDGAISGGTVTADKTTDVSANSTVTLTVTAGSEKVLNTIVVKDASNNEITTTKVTAGKKYTFTMPSSNATVTATFVNPYSTGLVGDIVFSDGKFITAENYEKYKSSLTQTPIAVIFNSSNKLGVGLKEGKNLQWAIASAQIHIIIAQALRPSYTIPSRLQELCSVPSTINPETATFSGITDGSGNWARISSECSDAGSGTDEATQTNYPAWYWVNTYANSAGLIGTTYADSWYMPSVKELCDLYKARIAVNIALVATAGDILEKEYWSSSNACLIEPGYCDNYSLDFRNAYATFPRAGQFAADYRKAFVRAIRAF